MAGVEDEKKLASVSPATLPGHEAHQAAPGTEPVESEVEYEKLAPELIDDVSSHDESVDDKEKKRMNLSRTWTQTTATSAATTEAPVDETPPHKRTWAERLNPLKRSHAPPVPKERTMHSREHEANFFSKLTFHWINPMMGIGYQRPLELNDIWLVNPDRRVEVMSTKLRAALKKRQQAGSRRPLALALFDTFRMEILLGGACQFTSACIQVLSPFTLKYLIRFAEDAYLHHYDPIRFPNAPPIGRGAGLVVAVTCMQIIQSVCTNHFIYRGMMVGGECRSVLISVIFEKAMRLSGRAKAGGVSTALPPSAVLERPEGLVPGSKQEEAWFAKKLAHEKRAADRQTESANIEGWSNGRITNLMSTDTYRIDQGFGMFHIAWTSPIQVFLSLSLLLTNLGYSALSGFAFIVVMVPLLGRAVRSLMKRRRVINKITDQRVSLTQEIISSVRFVKYFGWETSFLKRLESLRKSEISKISFLLSIRNGIVAVGMSTPIFAAMLSFITKKLTSPANLNPAPIFSSLALFNSLRIPLNLLPTIIGQIVDAFASVRRIEDFLDAEDIQDEATWDFTSKNAIELKDASFTWETARSSDESEKRTKDALKTTKELRRDEKAAKAERKRRSQMLKEKKNSSPDSAGSDSSASDEAVAQPFSIRGINLNVKHNELIAVIGSVSSGKSSLLAALAGDMRRTAGSVTFGAKRAFCPQYAWIQNASVRHNITFGKEYHRKWYNDVISACALEPDLAMLPHGDMTEIGERGITVSGGQKQRLNIARAIYFDADIVLMDDPLSAVDAHVGKHIMDNAICGLLKDKCRILATHQLHVLHRVDRIVWMKDGLVHKISTFPELMADDEEFQKLMATTASEESESKKQEAASEGDIAEKKETHTKKNRKAAALMQLEDRAVKAVGWPVYAAYVRAAGSIWIAPFMFALLVISQGANIVTSLWLSWWTSSRWGLSTGIYIGVYAGLAVVQAALMFNFAATVTTLGTKASRVMLNQAITRVLRSPMSFFDTTPMGRITNRFAKDVDVMDNMLSDSIRMFTITMAMIVSVFILIIAYFYYFAIALIPLFFVFVFSANYYRASARELKRHEAVLRSTVFSRFGEAVTGTATIRAYGMTKHFAQSVDDAIDDMDSAYFLTYANQRWLAVRLDAVGTCLVLTLGILVVTSRFSINPSISGLVLSYILSIVQMIQFTVRQLAEVENNMNSTERLYYYGTQLEEEAPLHMGDVRPSWPEKGEIFFDNVQMRYRAGLPLVLRGLTMRVKPGERIGVVGRTGAGKSSIMSTLFRLVELSGGSISIDGVNIAQIGLHDLRPRLAIIPQDPTLFKGTIRSNLDPFNEHNDLELWNALRQADLVGSEQDIEDDAGRIHLDSLVEDEGLNYSLGQRQMLALARALVRNAQIIVCDEATSSVDFETDQKIQQTIVRGFKGKTLLCIAHRLKTIIGYDRILVMDAGNVAELDTPIALYDQGGIFRSMCDRSGIRREDFFASAEANFTIESPAMERTESAAHSNP